MATFGGSSKSSSPLSDLSDKSSSSSESEENTGKKQRIWMRQDIKEKLLSELSSRSFGGTPFFQQSKNSQKKLLQIHMKKYMRKLQGGGTKDDVTTAPMSSCEGAVRLSKKDLKIQRQAKMQEAAKTGLNVAIDCSMEKTMSPKQLSVLARQIKLAYSSNVKCDKPFHLHLTGLMKDGKLYEALHQQFQGFDRVIPDITELTHQDHFQGKPLVYLTPDSPNILHDLKVDTVYVIGGLIDESVQWCYTYERALECKISTAKFPIDEHLIKSNPSANAVLTINQVMDILLDINNGKRWTETLLNHVPKRKGFILKN
jgi:tRNA (guanine9-N1)-methyltransferase